MITESQPPQNRGGYLDNHRRTLDASRRVLLPSEWRESDPATAYMILPWPLSRPQYLVALPPSRWQILVQRMGETSLSDPQAALVQRVLASSAVRVKPDNAGRILLPENLIKKININKEIVLAGRIEMFEIWEPSAFDETYQKDATQVDQIIQGWKI